jgi:hypothetical protein
MPKGNTTVVTEESASKGLPKEYKLEDIVEQINDGIRHKQNYTRMYFLLDAFDRGEQWKQYLNTVPKHQILPVENYINLVKEYTLASLSASSYMGRTLPLAPEDIDKSRIMNKVVESKWRQLDVGKYTHKAGERAWLHGTGITKVGWNQDNISGTLGNLVEGEMEFENVDPSQFYIDPTAYDLKEAGFCFIQKVKSITVLKTDSRFVKRLKTYLAYNQNPTPSQAPDDRGMVYDRPYSESVESQRNSIVLTEFYRKVPNEQGGYRIDLIYLANHEFVLYIQQGIQPNEFPFAILYDEEQAQDFFGLSKPYKVLSLQMTLNKITSIIATHAVLSQNPPKIYNKMMNINPFLLTQFGNIPNQSIGVDGDPKSAIWYVDFPKLDPSLFSLRKELIESIKEISGINDFYTGRDAGSIQTKGGIQEMVQRSTIRDKNKEKNLEYYLKDLTQLMIKFIKQYYTNRPIRVENPIDNDPEFLNYEAQAFQEIEFDYYIDVSAQTPKSRQAFSDLADKLLEMTMQYQPEVELVTAEEYAEMKDLPNKDAIIQRIKIQRAGLLAQQLSQGLVAVQSLVQQGMPEEDAIMQVAEQLVQLQEQAKKLGNTSSTGNMSIHQQRQGG